MITINSKKYLVNNNEFEKVPHTEFNNLIIRKSVGELERIISLICECNKVFEIKNLIIFNPLYGGFLPINCAKQFSNIYLLNISNEQSNNINTNIKNEKTKLKIFSEISIHEIPVLMDQSNNFFIYSENHTDIESNINNINFIQENNPIILTTYSTNISPKSNYVIYELTNSNLFLYIPLHLNIIFKEEFKYYINISNNNNNTNININNLSYDNLIHLCIMVKNGGDQFESMLQENFHLIDRWTILDTGSTDNTIDIINKVLVGKKKGDLFQGPFINFRDSRNRCFELAGNACKFILTLDDTYVISGDLRGFLNEVRGDQLSTSFTLFIHSEDTEYGSNRIIKSDSGLRYIHKIHEVITDKNNINVVIPNTRAKIIDRRFDYMENRTMSRKQLDLQLLYEEVEDDPTNPRSYYYLAQTYNLLEQYDKTYYYFLKRAEFTNSGFIQERIDALFEAARTANFKLNKPWPECLALYEKCYKVDESRPDAIYFIGIHYYLENDFETAYKYFKLGFEIGFPSHCQYSLKPTISFHFLPKFLAKICYQFKNYKLGEAAAELFLLKNDQNSESYAEIVSWYNIYKKLNMYTGDGIPKLPIKPIFCFVADGGFNKWSGKNIITTGVGGSETYIIEMARYIQRSGNFEVFVFCNCEESENFEDVKYKPLNYYYAFVNENYIHTCIVSRFSEYLPVTFKGWAENVYLVVHDLTPSGIVIPIDNKLKNIFCLTEWHVEHMSACFPTLKHLLVPFYYGIDSSFSTFEKGCNEVRAKTKDKFLSKNIIDISTFEKGCNEVRAKTSVQPFSKVVNYIYSSFPNRGLLPLLQMWPRILTNNHLSHLHIYADVLGKWVNEVAKETIDEIKSLLFLYDREYMNVHYHGWVDKKTLAEAWLNADVWFYPCTFQETFCLTALEAALTKTLVITNDLAALQNTVGNRGIIIKGDPMNELWQNVAIQKIQKYVNQQNILTSELIEENYEWASSLSWESQALKLLNQYILPRKLEYKEMFNWDFNKGTLTELIIYYNNSRITNNSTRVLEVGTYTGVSLINIVKQIPNSSGQGIDTWTKLDKLDNLLIEQSFYNNVKREGLENRIKGIKGDSTKVLINLTKKNELFNFIYIDLGFELLTDMVLAWQILEKNGILAINTPYSNVFLHKFIGEYKVLYQGTQLYLEKI
jgi:predicted O-methyltransferase YrrM